MTARSAGSASPPRSSAMPRAARSGWSARISTSPTACWPGTLARKRGALPPDRRQRAGSDLGHQARSHARLRQPGLSRFPRPALRTGRRLRLAQGAAPRRSQTRILQEQLAGEASLKPFVLEARYRRADGEWRWLRSESQPRWDPTGKHIGFIGVAHDITAAKEAEGELRRLNETLEQRISERTAQLRVQRGADARHLRDQQPVSGAARPRRRHHLRQRHLARRYSRPATPTSSAQPFWDTPWFAAPEATRARIRDAFAAVRARRSGAHRDAAVTSGRRPLLRFRACGRCWTGTAA